MGSVIIKFKSYIMPLSNTEVIDYYEQQNDDDNNDYDKLLILYINLQHIQLHKH